MRKSPPVRAILLVFVASSFLAGAARAQALYWTNTTYGSASLQRSTDNGTGVTSVALGPTTLPEGLAVDPTFAKVYWVEAAWSGARVNEAWFDLSGASALVTGGSAFRGLALDAVDDKLYWSSSNLALGGRIHRANQNGTNAQVLISLPATANPRGMAVDHAAGKLYWADFGQDQIVFANLDGTGVTPLIGLPAGSGPYGLTLDPAGQFLYWTEFNTGFLRRAPTSGASVNTIYTGLANPTHLALDPALGRLFWIEGAAGAQRLRRGSTAGGMITNLPPAISTYGGLAFVSGGVTSTPEVTAPLAFAIERIWPSPAAGSVHVAFTLPREGDTRLSVLDLQGREIAVLVDGTLPAGRHEPVWDPAHGAHAPRAGIYFVRLVSEHRSIVRRLALTR